MTVQSWGNWILYHTCSVAIWALRGASKQMPDPPGLCGVRGCVGDVSVVKDGSKVVCKVKSYHEAFLTKSAEGTVGWEWTTRGAKFLKGKVFDKKNEPTAVPLEAKLIDLVEKKSKSASTSSKQPVADPTLDELDEPIPIQAPETEPQADTQTKPSIASSPSEKAFANSSTPSPKKKDVAMPSPEAVALSKSSMKRASPSSSEKTPAKKATVETDETPAKKPRIPGFGGKLAKQNECKVCGAPRDEGFIGGCCNFCLTGCRRVCNHQRIADILDDKDLKAQILEISEKNRAEHKPDTKRGRCQCDCREMAGLVKQMKSMLPKMQAALEKLELLRNVG